MKLIFTASDVVSAIAKYARCTEASVKLVDGLPDVLGECSAVPAISNTGRPRGKRAQKQVEKTYPVTPE